MVPISILQIVLNGLYTSYRWLDNNFVGNLANLARDFLIVLSVCLAVIFLAICVLSVLKQAKKLPKSYSVEIINVYGEKTAVEGLRQIFSTYEAAESYARFYRDEYGDQYKFRVIGHSNDH